ncbi:MAG: antibiotic biosynthesis monooxygenase [Deltaproteobacteria bacterium]|nr:antibiotic biosynthesis monooxygenase [Deltaproteobacteria bacterium]
MAVKVVIRRIIPEHRAEDLKPLLRELRTMAMLQPGYISGETLRRLDKPDEFLVISTWESAEDWNRWAKSQERNEVQGKIDTVLGGKTEFGIFHHEFSE